MFDIYSIYDKTTVDCFEFCSDFLSLTTDRNLVFSYRLVVLE